MTPYSIIEKKLRENMVQGEMHASIRDTGRLAGGYLATGSLSNADINRLSAIVESLSINKPLGLKKWQEAVEYGRAEPVKWQDCHRYTDDCALDWDDCISSDSLQFIKQEWVIGDAVTEPDVWDPAKQIITYIEALYEHDDFVGYVTEAYQNEDRWLPTRGCYDRTAKQLIKELTKCNGDIGAVLGDTNDKVGAWIRFNPVDGKGVKDENVTAFRFALVECDNIEIGKQIALIKELDLPVATLTHSGGKSVHATVRIDAANIDEYRKRVDFLYEVCAKNGLSMDKQNRNPSRLSRLPGVIRNGKKQWLIDTNIGKSSWDEWQDWVQAINDELPDITEIDSSDEEPELSPVLIDGILREGHKLILSGASKAGKSFALIQLATAFAVGGSWFNWRVTQGKCLYLNLELDAASCRHRFWSIRQAAGLVIPKGMIDVWNLRGNATTLDKLAPKLIRRAKDKNYKAVIIDPIYKVLTGDENSASEMANFCNWFDRIALSLGAATIYCHHHSKGAQGQKSSRDRSSGSGVFTRDPDAILDMIELVIDKDRRETISNRWQCDDMTGHLNDAFPDWQEHVSQDDEIKANVLFQACEKHCPSLYRVREKAKEEAAHTSGWRIETTLREFRSARPNNVFFRYPLHVMDAHDLLKDAKADGEESPQERFINERRKRNEEEAKQANENTLQAIEMCRTEDGVCLKDVIETLGISDTAARKRIKKTGLYVVDSGMIKRIKGKANTPKARNETT